jgi:hypothetical protein
VLVLIQEGKYKIQIKDSEISRAMNMGCCASKGRCYGKFCQAEFVRLYGSMNMSLE